jgi:putative protein-disulfide isomerase
MNANSRDTGPTPTVVYANDPLCGWCFAIGPSLNEARERLGGDVQWHLACGGLVTGDRVRPIALDSDYLVAGFAQVKAASGREPGERYWSDVVKPGTWISNSEPACRAVLLAQQRRPEIAMQFSHALTDALYLHGQTPDNPETLGMVAEYGLDPVQFIAAWDTQTAVDMTAAAFAHARSLGVTTYPSLFLEVGSQLVPILAGFANASDIEARVRQAIAANISDKT